MDGLPAFYVSIFANFPQNNDTSFNKILLSIFPFENEELEATECNDYLSFILKLYGKNSNNVFALIVDYVPVNKYFARNIGSPYVVCVSHRFNFAVKDVFSEYTFEVERFLGSQEKCLTESCLLNCVN